MYSVKAISLLFSAVVKPASATAKTCASCNVNKTPLWRDAEDGTPLCNACGIRYGTVILFLFNIKSYTKCRNTLFKGDGQSFFTSLPHLLRTRFAMPSYSIMDPCKNFPKGWEKLFYLPPTFIADPFCSAYLIYPPSAFAW